MPALIYAVALGSFSFWIYHKFLYRDVANWPSVPAYDLKGGSAGGGAPYFGRDGRLQSPATAQWTSYRYEVDDVTYQGTRHTPGGNEIGFPMSPMQVVTRPDGSRSIEPLPPRAHYHPQRPSVAVLVPMPYRSDALEITMAVSGLLAILHLGFSLKKDW
jgi:hypothetical protein